MRHVLIVSLLVAGNYLVPDNRYGADYLAPYSFWAVLLSACLAYTFCLGVYYAYKDSVSH